MDAAEVIESNEKISKEDKGEDGYHKNQDVLALNVNLIPSKLPQPTQQQPNKETIKSAEADFVKTILEWNEQQVDKPDEDRGKEEEEDESEKEEPKTCHMVFEVGIQANDYDIERRSGRVPSRKRIIPFKFRDYRNPENVDKEKSDSDSDFDYQLPVPTKFVKVKHRKPGRPKKEIIPTIIEVPSTSVVTTETTEPDTAAASSSVVKETNSPATTSVYAPVVKVNGNKTVAYACDKCNRVFLQKGNLKVHQRLHTDERPYPCEFGNCDKKFRSNETLRRHKLTHTGEKPFTCVTCNNKFSSKVSLTEHQAIHDNTKNYKCDQCGRSFRQVSCFKRHQVTHTMATPYICDVCGKSFSQMAYLRSHSKVHSGLRPFSCDTCKKTFASKSDVTRHKIIHSGLKPYKCTHCTHQFSDASSCRRHIREHSQARPYICYKCGEGFKRTGQLKVHIGRRHANKDEQDMIKKEPMDAIDHIKDQEESELNINLSSQRKMVSLIKNLNRNIVVQQVEIASPDKTKNQLSETVYVEEVNVASVTDNDLIQLSQAVENSTNQLEIPLQEVPGRQDTEKTVLAITESENGGNYETYQIIQGLSENSNEQQVFEVRYQDNEEPSKPDTPLVDPETARDYVANPDFGSQEYYNWLSNFTELCKMVPMPLDVSLFQKMSQVHKTLSDVMATPTGVVADKENYRVLMTISRDLNMIISEHLNFVLQNLAEDQIPS